MIPPVPEEHILVIRDHQKQGTYNFARCVATDDGIVDQQNNLVLEFGRDGRQLSSNTLLSCLLARLQYC